MELRAKREEEERKRREEKRRQQQQEEQKRRQEEEELFRRKQVLTLPAPSQPVPHWLPSATLTHLVSPPRCGSRNCC